MTREELRAKYMEEGTGIPRFEEWCFEYGKRLAYQEVVNLHTRLWSKEDDFDKAEKCLYKIIDYCHNKIKELKR